MRKLLSIVWMTCLVLLISALLATPAQATEAPSGLMYSISNNEVTITGYNGTATDLKIPSTIEGYPVTNIGNRAFASCHNLTNISIPDTIKTIGYGSFAACTGLTEIVIPDSVTHIKQYAFSTCKNIQEIKVPANVSYIGAHAFIYCENLKTIIFEGDKPNFECCACISEPWKDHPDDLPWVEFDDFSYRIFSNVTAVAYYPANNDTWRDIASQDLEGKLTWVEGEPVDGFVFEISNNEVLITGYTGVPTNLEIPGVIKGYPVTVIDSCAFEDCDSLTNITLPDSLTTIGNSAFSGCRNLTKISIPASVKRVYPNAFSGCSSLTGVYITDLAAWSQIFFGDINYDTDASCKANPLYYAKELYLNGTLTEDLVIPDTVVEIGNYAFSNCGSIKSVLIPDSVTDIGLRAFYGCSDLTEIVIGENIDIIGLQAFSNTPSLDRIDFLGNYPGFLSTPSQDMFPEVNLGDGCEICYQRIVCLDGVEATAYYPADDATWKVHAKHDFKSDYPENITWLPSSIPNDFNYTISGGEVTITCYTGTAKELEIPAVIAGYPVTCIAYSAFRDCSNLTKVTIPDSVTTISFQAFYNCRNLTDVIIGKNVNSFTANSLFNCGNLRGFWVNAGNPFYSSDEKGNLYNKNKTELICVPSGITGSYTVSGSVTSIGNDAFFGCKNLTIVTIPNSVTYMGYSVFSSCTSLKEIWVYCSANAIQWTSYDIFPEDSLDGGSSIVHENGTFVYIGAKPTIYFPIEQMEAVVEDGIDAVFAYFGITVEGLEYYVSKNEATITKYTGTATAFTIPETIGDYTVKKIADYAFADSTLLKSVIFTGDAPYIAPNAFQNVTASVSYMSNKSTWTQDTLQNYGGNLTWIGMLPKVFLTASIILKDDLSVRFGVNAEIFESGVYTEPYAVFTVGVRTQKVTTYTVHDGKYYFTFDNISPSQIGDKIIAVAYAMKNGVATELKSFEYGVSKYCYSMLEKTEEANLRTLLVDLLNYGSAAQIYAGYKTTMLCNRDLTEEQKSWGTQDDPTLCTMLNSKYKTVKNPKVEWTGASLVLEKNVTMRFRFKADYIDGLTVKIKTVDQEWNVSEFEPVAGKEDQYYVYFRDLSARQMREILYVSVYENNTCVSNTLRYSIESYAYNKQYDANPKLAALVKAMMRYGISAENYLG